MSRSKWSRSSLMSFNFQSLSGYLMYMTDPTSDGSSMSPFLSTTTRSRPSLHVSNDNPYSEAAFKTLKYAPGFPERFGSLADARAFGERFLRLLQP